MADQKRIDLLGFTAYAAYVAVGGLLVFGFAWSLSGAVEVQNESRCRALDPEPRVRVHGVVQAAGGEPVADAEIALEGGGARQTAKTDEAGQFSVFVPAEVYSLSATGPRGATAETVLRPEAGEELELAVELGAQGGTVSEASRGPWRAPDFEVKDLQGNTVRLSDFRGQFVVLNFWATWCEPCISEWPQVHKLAQRLGGEDVTVLAVSIDEDESAIAPFLQRMSLSDTPVRVLWDPTQSVQKTFGTEKIPDTYFIDEAGNVRYAFVNVRKWGSPEAYHCVTGHADV